MKTVNEITKVVRGSGLALATILIVTFAAVYPANAQYKPTGADGITASPRLRAQLDQRNAGTTPGPASVPTKRWILSSPRTLEQYPELQRQSSVHDVAQERARSDALLAAIKKHTAFAASPPVREQFPELDRSAQVATAVGSKAGVETASISELLKNRAWGMSPRRLELYPWLANYDWDASKRIGVIK